MPPVKLPTLEVAVVIPVKGKFEDLALTLDSLDKLNSDFADTVVVVDGHQKEIIDGLDKKTFKHIEPTTILNDNTRGSYYSRNRGYKHTSAAYVWFIDSGVEVLRDCKAALKSVIDLELDYSGGAIELAYPQSREVEIIDILTKLTEFKVKRCLQYRHFAPTANLLVKRSILDQVKGFNPTLYSGGDQEFGYRVWKAGFSQHYIKQLKVSHQTRSKEELYLKAMRVIKGQYDVYNIDREIINNPLSIKRMVFEPISIAKRSYVVSKLSWRFREEFKKYGFSLWRTLHGIGSYLWLHAKARWVVFNSKNKAHNY